MTRGNINSVKILQLWRKKIGTLNVVAILIILFFALLLYVSTGVYNLFNIQLTETGCLAQDIELQNAQKKIMLLSSVLKKYNVPEVEYLEKHYVTIYVITPTYKRPEQKAELTRLKNVFLHVPGLHWILVEDAGKPTSLVSNFLSSSMLPYTHLFVQTPPDWKLKEKEPRWRKPRGVLQRNKGINWLRENLKSATSGVVYFADDDNTYSIELFKEIRDTKLVSVWPVGLVGEVLVERPVVDSKGKVVGWHAGWRPDRPFATDMAGFAISLVLLLNTPGAFYSHESKRGFMESDFLEKLVQLKNLEPKANNCSKVLVWHTQTKETKLRQEEKLKKLGHSTNINIEI